MPFCPKCGKEIDRLISVEYPTYVEDWEVYINEDGNLDYGECLEKETIDSEIDGYKCPECGATLFYSWGEAEEFLKGDVEAQIKAMKVLKKGGK